MFKRDRQPNNVAREEYYKKIEAVQAAAEAAGQPFRVAMAAVVERGMKVLAVPGTRTTLNDPQASRLKE